LTTILATAFLAIVAAIMYYLKNGSSGSIRIETIGYALFAFCIAIVIVAALK